MRVKKWALEVSLGVSEWRWALHGLPLLSADSEVYTVFWQDREHGIWKRAAVLIFGASRESCGA